MEIREGRDTLAFFKYEDRVILWTKVPHKKGEVKGKLGYFIRQQLKVNEAQFQKLLDCIIGCDEYIQILRAKGIIK
jgi:hypothetical protein